MQGEITVYVVAQSMPLIRVLLQGRSSSVERTGGSQPKTTHAGQRTGAHPGQAPDTAIELIQLPSGRIVPADSEEGKPFKASGMGRAVDNTVTDNTTRPLTPVDQVSAAVIDDEVHRVWAGMGLSKRAWSQSPPDHQMSRS